jgi:hypothetical protein
MSDPYQPPTSELRRAGEGSLYSVRGIVIASIVGSLAAGIVMLYWNYRTLGRTQLAQRWAPWGAGIYTALILIATLLPNTVTLVLVYNVFQATVAYFLASQLQGAAIKYHQSQGGSVHSNMRAAGVGFLTGIVLLFFLLLATGLWTQLTGTLPAT